MAGPSVALASSLTVTTCAGSGSGSLFTVVAGAAAGDTITFASGLSCPPASPITLASTLTITGNLTITGPGAAVMAVSGGGSVQVLHITSGTVGISGLTIEDGNGATGGGIDNAGTLHLADVAVTGNTATSNTSGGGGIYNTGTLHLADVAVTGNTATGNPSAGGGIYAAGHVTLTDSTVSGNDSVFGGGIWSYFGAVTVIDSTISDNKAQGGYGGGIYSWNQATLTVTDSTVAGNTAFLYGGGILSAGEMTITASTIADNTATNKNAQGGGVFRFSGRDAVGGSIVAGNTGGNAPNCEGPLASTGYNLTDDAFPGECGFVQKTDRMKTDPLLAPLADNGGPTATMLPARRSPAVGVIPPGTTLNGVRVCPRTDQRGVTSRAYCTIGSVEVTAPFAYGVTIAARSNYEVKPYTLVVYHDRAVHDGLRWDQAKISGRISGAGTGDVAALYAKPFGAKNYSALGKTIRLSGISPERYSFTVAPTLATAYQVRVTTAPKTDAMSTVVAVYVSSYGAVTRPHVHCSAGSCTASYREYKIIPASAYKTEAAKHWFFYFELGQRHPKYLFLDNAARTSKPRKVKATEFSVTFTFTYTGSATSYWWAEGCVQDSLSRDGLGLPGHHGCGAKRIRFSARYIG
jgi:predicted outer membrane repeat protein